MRGQAAAKRALIVAAAGGHSLLLIGPPGTGKSMLAQRLPGLLPPLDGRRRARRRVDRLGEPARLRAAGVRAPAVPRAASHRLRGRHHRRRTARAAGRGEPRASRRAVPRRAARVQPRRARESARTAGERRRRDLARVAAAAVSGALPARRRDESLPLRLSRRCHAADCRCPPREIARYRARISGPLLDRIDIRVEVPAVASEELLGGDARGPETASRRGAQCWPRASGSWRARANSMRNWTARKPGPYASSTASVASSSRRRARS